MLDALKSAAGGTAMNSFRHGAQTAEMEAWWISCGEVHYKQGGKHALPPTETAGRDTRNMPVAFPSHWRIPGHAMGETHRQQQAGKRLFLSALRELPRPRTGQRRGLIWDNDHCPTAQQLFAGSAQNRSMTSAAPTRFTTVTKIAD